MKNLVAVPVLALAIIVQMAVISRITLLSGAADIVLIILIAWALQEQVESAWHWAVLAGLLVAFVSAVPPYVPVIGYLITIAFARFVIRQIWQTPMLALFSVTFFSTLAYNLLTYIALVITGTRLPFEDTLALIVLPSVFLNLLLAIPIHALLRDLALWVYPLEELI